VLSAHFISMKALRLMAASRAGLLGGAVAKPICTVRSVPSRCELKSAPLQEKSACLWLCMQRRLTRVHLSVDCFGSAAPMAKNEDSFSKRFSHYIGTGFRDLTCSLTSPMI